MANKVLASALVAALALVALSGCGATDGGASSEKPTLKYWATNQGSSVADDEKILRPELAKFEKKTGIKVELEVVGWNDLQTRILTATTSGNVPDVTNLGNTWAPTLQGTDAFVPWDAQALAKVGGKERFLASALASGGSTDAKVPPQTLPLYARSYTLYYNKKLFAAAGISNPPKTWEEFDDTAKKLADPTKGVYGAGFAGGQPGTNANMIYILAGQHGASLYDGKKPTFTGPKLVDAVEQYVGWIRDGVATPDSAEWSDEASPLQPFADGKIAMMLAQGAGAALESLGMDTKDVGVSLTPLLDPLPAGGKPMRSFVSGSNIAIFRDSRHVDAAFKLVKFLTSPAEQRTLNVAYGTVPVVTDVDSDPAFKTPESSAQAETLKGFAFPSPQVASAGQATINLGGAIKDLMAMQVTQGGVSKEAIEKALKDAQERMPQ